MARPLNQVLVGDEPLTVYTAKQYEELKNIRWWTYHHLTYQSNVVVSKEIQSKHMSLVPFFFESGFTHKFFVIKMSLDPKAGYLHYETLGWNGVQSVYVPVANVIPVTKYDYWAVSRHVWFKQHQCLDLDMIYANRVTKEMFLFEKDGTWHDEGVAHEALSVEKTYNETNWYDEFNVHNF